MDQLPAFHVTAIEDVSPDPRLSGVFTHLTSVREGRSWLYAATGPSLIGDLVDLDTETRRATFVAPFWTHACEVQVGSIAPWLDGRWQAYHVEMIVNPDANWKRLEFEAATAQHFVQGRAHGWVRLGSSLPADSTPTYTQPGGWDHEHCELCDRRIGTRGDQFGYVDRDDHWLCEGCHNAYARVRSLEFVLAIS